MIETLFSPGYMPFAIALGVMLSLVILEMLSMVLGFAFSHMVDSALDIDHGLQVDHAVDALDPGVEGHAGADHAPFGAQVLDWLHVGAVPILFLFMIFLAAFGLTGLAIQTWLPSMLSPWLAAIPALAVAILSMRFLGGLARKVAFKDETSAVSHDSFVGMQAVITLGQTERGKPTQAKLRDKYDLTHYVLIEPLREGDTFDSGDTVLLVQRDGHKYFVIDTSVETLLSLSPEDLATENRQKA